LQAINNDAIKVSSSEIQIEAAFISAVQFSKGLFRSKRTYMHLNNGAWKYIFSSVKRRNEKRTKTPTTFLSR
jgi:hypothetical protein